MRGYLPFLTKETIDGEHIRESDAIQTAGCKPKPAHLLVGRLHVARGPR
jgi:hypothetical protein